MGDKVPGPDMVFVPGLLRQSRGKTLAAHPLLGRWHLQAFFPAHPLHLLLVDSVTQGPQLSGNFLITFRGIAQRHGDDDFFFQHLLPSHHRLGRVTQRGMIEPQPPTRFTPGTSQRGDHLRSRLTLDSRKIRMICSTVLLVFFMIFLSYRKIISPTID